MLASISNFGNNAAALEKTLRLGQALAQVGASLAVTSKDAAPWILARGQFNLSRRFFRLHKWIDHWGVAQEKFNAQEDDAVLKMLDVTKNGFLGMYFFLEMGTITNVMGITDTTWGPQLQQESNKFWFYAIATSIMLSLYQVFFGLQPAQAAEKGSEKEASSITNEKGAQEQNEPKETTSASTEKVPPIPAQARDKSIQVYRQLLIDGCDLFIPGATVGWIPAEPLTVGIFMSISTVLAMGSMWPKIQADAAASAKKK